MTPSPTEEEIVARAIEELFLERSGYSIAEITKAAIHALDQYRAKNAGEELQSLRVAAHRQLRAASDDGWDLSPLAEYIEAAERLITSLRSIIGEKDEALRQIVQLEQARRSGGPDVSDLEGLDDAVRDATDLAANALRSYLSDGVK